MKRVDFDPNGQRNPQNRGKSGYERISWDKALDIVAGEITRQKKVHGPGAIAIAAPAHHQWGNINYYLSAMQRFGNLIGYTRVDPSPISWEGWYWGAMHHYGNNMRLGVPGFYGTVDDCLENAEQIVFWSSDPEATSGVYSGFEGTERRLWAKEVGIDFVHIDPALTKTAQFLGGKWIPIRPGNGLRARDSHHARMDGQRHVRQGVCRRSEPPASTSGAPMFSEERTAFPRPRSGRRPKLACRPRTRARWPRFGRRSGPIWQPADWARDLAGPAAPRRARIGREAWS